MKLLWNSFLILSLIALLGACSVTVPNAQPPVPPLPPVPQAVPVALSAPAPISTPSEIAPKNPPPIPILKILPSQRPPLKIRAASLNGTTFTACHILVSKKRKR